MGFAQKSAGRFFGLIRQHEIQVLADVRRNNRSQLAGFTKGSDLVFFLPALYGCRYSHREDCAPSKEILEAYRKGILSWEEYESRYVGLLEQRRAVPRFLQDYGSLDRVLLLCSEPTAENCHRRVLAERIAVERPDIRIIHL